MPSYKFYYFNGRGLGEIIRQLFAIGGIDFEDIRIQSEQWTEIKPTMPLGQMPVLEIDGQKIPQSLAIARYVAKKTGHAGKDDFENALVDALADQYKDFYVEIKSFYYPALGIHPADKETIEKAKNEVLFPARDRYFGQMIAFLKKSGSGFLVGDGLTFADLILAEHVSTILSVVPNYAEGFPEIEAHLKKIHAIPELKAWLDKRPVTAF